MVDLPVANMLTYIIIIIIHHHHMYECISGVPGVPPQAKAARVLPAVHGVGGGTALPHHPAAGEGGLRVPHQGKGRQYPAVSLTEGFVLWVGCLTSKQHASVSQGRICSDSFTCCHTEMQVADQTFYLTQSHYTDTGPTSPSADLLTPGTWQGSPWSANFEVTGMTQSRKNPGTSRNSNPGSSALEAYTLPTRPTRRSDRGMRWDGEEDGEALEFLIREKVLSILLYLWQRDVMRYEEGGETFEFLIRLRPSVSCCISDRGIRWDEEEGGEAFEFLIREKVLSILLHYMADPDWSKRHF